MFDYLGVEGCIGAVLWAMGCAYAVWCGVCHGMHGGVLAAFV